MAAQIIAFPARTRAAPPAAQCRGVTTARAFAARVRALRDPSLAGVSDAQIEMLYALSRAVAWEDAERARG